MKLPAPGITPILDSAFRPAVLANRAFDRAIYETEGSLPIELALEQADGSVFRFKTHALLEAHPAANCWLGVSYRSNAFSVVPD